MALSDKAVYVYDVFFSAYVTKESFDSQLKQSSLMRLAFEEVISYPNLLESMQAHDRYDEIIGTDTTAFELIKDNITREENSKLESNAFIYITTEGRTQAEFDAFLNTVSGHIGFGIIIDNAKTAYDIAESTTAVSLILGNDEALDALLNAPNGLKAFTENPNSAAAIFSNVEVFKKLRQYLKFNQTEVFDDVTASNQHVEYVGGRYFIMKSGQHSSFLWSDDLKTWNTASHPTQEFNYDQRWNCIAYDPLNQRWFFNGYDTVLGKGSILWNSGDFSGAFTAIAGSFGTATTLSITNLNDSTIVATYRNSSNQWDFGKIVYTQGQAAYELLNVPSYGVNTGYYYLIKGENNVLATDAGYNFGLINQDLVRYTAVNGAQGGTSYHGLRHVTYQNGRFWVSQYYNAAPYYTYIMTFPDEVGYELTTASNTYNYDRYTFETGTTEIGRLLYANGIYIVPMPRGYSTSLNGYTWDKSLFDVTYSFQLAFIDERGIVGSVPGTRFVLSSYDLSAEVNQITTTTTTTAAPLPTGLDEGLTRLECLVEGKGINKVHYNQWRILFNEKTDFDNTYYVLEDGVYTIENIPQTDPLAVLNSGKFNQIEYTGDPTKKLLKNVVGSNNDDVYDFYYGDLTIKVKGNFERVSLWSYANGSLGMENIFIHQDFLNGLSADNDTVTADTEDYDASSFTNFTCDGNAQVPGDQIVRVDVTTTTTTIVPDVPVLPDTLPTTSTTTENLGDQNYSTAINLGHTEYDIILDGPIADKLAIQGQGSTFEDLAAAGFRNVLSQGTYIFNVPDTMAIAIIGATSSGNFGPQHSNISYSGDFYKRSIKGVDGVPYYFYYGQVTVIVDRPFATVSLYEFSLGYAGAENCFSWDFSSVPTTTIQPTTTSTTLANTFYTDCLPNEVDVTVNGNNELEFNAEAYNPYLLQGLGNGQYLLKGVPETHAITLVNDGKYSLIKIQGDADKNFTDIGPDGIQYNYFYGDVKVIVSGDFGRMSYHTRNNGYAGGQDKLIYNQNCGDSQYVIPTTSTTTLKIPFTIS